MKKDKKLNIYNIILDDESNGYSKYVTNLNNQNFQYSKNNISYNLTNNISDNKLAVKNDNFTTEEKSVINKQQRICITGGETESFNNDSLLIKSSFNDGSILIDKESGTLEIKFRLKDVEVAKAISSIIRREHE